jgi:hypothetical protein
LVSFGCGSSDASLGRNREAESPGPGAGGSSSAGTGNGSSGSGNGSSGTGNGSSGSGNGSSGTGNDTGGAGGSSGGGTDDCENVQCIRPINCVESCGGPVLKSSCCPCDPGTFDDIECGAPGGIPPGLNQDCVDDMCPEGLTPVQFYGIAGPAGPLFCWCTIPCEDDPNVCPDGTSCTNVADGPGNVCYEQN